MSTSTLNPSAPEYVPSTSMLNPSAPKYIPHPPSGVEWKNPENTNFGMYTPPAPVGTSRRRKTRKTGKKAKKTRKVRKTRTRK